MRSRRGFLTATLPAVGLLLAACGSGTNAGSEPQSTAPQAASVSAPTVGQDPAGTAAPIETAPVAETTPPNAVDPVAPAEAPEALQFTGTLVGGGEIDFTSFAGQSVALWFWAPT